MRAATLVPAVAGLVAASPLQVSGWNATCTPSTVTVAAPASTVTVTNNHTTTVADSPLRKDFFPTVITKTIEHTISGVCKSQIALTVTKSGTPSTVTEKAMPSTLTQHAKTLTTTITEKAHTSTVNNTVVESSMCPKPSALSMKTVTQIKHSTSTVHVLAAPVTIMEHNDKVVTKTIISTTTHIDPNPHNYIGVNAPPEVSMRTAIVYSTTKIIPGTVTKDGTRTVVKTIDHHNTIALGEFESQVTETVYSKTTKDVTVTEEGTATIIETAGTVAAPIPVDAFNGAAAVEAHGDTLEIASIDAPRPGRLEVQAHEAFGVAPVPGSPNAIEIVHAPKPPTYLPAYGPTAEMVEKIGIRPAEGSSETDHSTLELTREFGLGRPQGSPKMDRPEVQDSPNENRPEVQDIPKEDRLEVQDHSVIKLGGMLESEQVEGLGLGISPDKAIGEETTESATDEASALHTTVTHITHINPGLDGFVGIPGASTYETTSEEITEPFSTDGKWLAHKDGDGFLGPEPPRKLRKRFDVISKASKEDVIATGGGVEDFFYSHIRPSRSVDASTPIVDAPIANVPEVHFEKRTEEGGEHSQDIVERTGPGTEEIWDVSPCAEWVTGPEYRRDCQDSCALWVQNEPGRDCDDTRGGHGGENLLQAGRRI